jgi:hypothetical protein
VSIVIRIRHPETRNGVTVHHVCLQSGTLIGCIEQATADSFTARSAEGHSLVHGDTEITFPSLTDAAAQVWMSFMARRADPSYTIARSQHAG